MKKNLLAFLLFGTLLVISKKECHCNNNGNEFDDDDNGKNGDDGDDKHEEGGGKGKGSGTGPVKPVKPAPPKPTKLDPYTKPLPPIKDPWIHATPDPWVATGEPIKKPTNTIYRKGKRIVTTAATGGYNWLKSTAAYIDPWAVTTQDPWINIKPTTTATKGKGKGNNGDDGTGGNGNDDDVGEGNGKDDDDDDDDDECKCVKTTKKPLPKCWDGWKAWDFCKINKDCPPSYFCDLHLGGCCPEKPWRQQRINNVNNNNGNNVNNGDYSKLTNDIEYYYVKHPVLFVIMCAVITVVFCGIIFYLLNKYYLNKIKNNNNNKKLIQQDIEGDRNNVYNDKNSVELIDIESYQTTSQ